MDQPICQSTMVNFHADCTEKFMLVTLSFQRFQRFQDNKKFKRQTV